MDEFDIEGFIRHIGETTAMWANEEKLFLSAKTGEERETHGIRALHLYHHIVEDLDIFGQIGAITANMADSDN